MTMERMCDHLATRGFMVDKKYDKTTKSYKFCIAKDGWTLTRYFKYPVDVNQATRDRIQREFLDEMIEQFNKDIAKWKPVPDKIPVSKLAADMIKAMNEIYERKKGEDMGNRRIKWRVERVECTRSPDTIDTTINAMLTGVADPLFTGYVGDVRWELQRHLDKYMKDDEVTKYITEDIANTWELPFRPRIMNVIFNDPATIVFWQDGTKTVVKCQADDTFDPEKGLAMAFVKKVLGNKGNYCNEIKKWLPEKKEEKEPEINIVLTPVDAKTAADNIAKALDKAKQLGIFRGKIF
jgi:phage tail sheath gpL-like